MILDQRRLIRAYYGFQIFFPLLLWVPVFYEYQRRVGISDAEYFEIQSYYYLIFCLFELPTGMLADVWGYRRNLWIGSMLLVLTNLIPVFLTSYTAFFFHFVLVALARSFYSGAASAYLYQALEKQGQASSYKKIEGMARSYALMARVVGWAAVGPLMAWNLQSPYWMTAIISLLAFGCAWILPVDQRKTSSLDSKKIQWDFTGAFYLLRSKPLILVVMVQGIGIFALERLCLVNLYQPILKSQGFPVIGFGGLMSAITLAEALGARMPKRLKMGTLLHDSRIVIAMSAVIAASLTFVAWGVPLVTVIAFLVFGFAMGVAFPIQKQILNDVITDDRYRATLLSIESILDRIASALLVAQTASFVATGKLGTLLGIAAAFTLLLSGGAYFFLRRERAS